MTTIESANRIVWLTPRSSIRRAIGSCTLGASAFLSSPAPRRPRPCSGTPRMPSAVMRIAAGSRRSWSRRLRPRPHREEEDDRHQVRERGDDLHRVEHGVMPLKRRERPAATPRGMPTRIDSPTAASMSAERLHALGPQARERRTTRMPRSPRLRRDSPPKRQDERRLPATVVPIHVSQMREVVEPGGRGCPQRAGSRRRS